MLRANSNAAKINVMNYIREAATDELEERNAWNVEHEGAAPVDLSNDNNICRFIWDIFHEEKYNGAEAYYHFNTFTAFNEWAQGLALGGLFLYYYNVPAVELAAAILEETPAEAARYTETEAEELITRLIYRVVMERAAVAL